MAPTLLPIAAWAVVRRRRQSNWQVLVVPVAIFGAALTFQALSYATGSTFPFLRFYIIAVPLTAFLAVLAVPDGCQPSSSGAAGTPAAHDSPAGAALAAGLPPGPAGARGLRAIHRVGHEPAEVRTAGIRAGGGPGPDPTAPVRARRSSVASRRRSRPNATSRATSRTCTCQTVPSSPTRSTASPYWRPHPARRPSSCRPTPTSSPCSTIPSTTASATCWRSPTGRGLSDALNLRYPTLYDGRRHRDAEPEIPNDGDSHRLGGSTRCSTQPRRSRRPAIDELERGVR